MFQQFWTLNDNANSNSPEVKTHTVFAWISSRFLDFEFTAEQF